MIASTVEVVEAPTDQRQVLSHLLQLCLHEFAFFDRDSGGVDEDGLYPYPYLDDYWVEAVRHPYIVRLDGLVAGFALVRSGDPHQMAEFFILPKYRRAGVATDAARQLFEAFPGQWEVRQMVGNVAATAFWRKAIPYVFVEMDSEDGITQRFEVPRP